MARKKATTTRKRAPKKVQFKECEECSAKSGTPDLCSKCIQTREAIETPAGRVGHVVNVPLVEPEPKPQEPKQIVHYHPRVIPHTICPECGAGYSRIYRTGQAKPTIRHHECFEGHRYRSRQV